MSFLYLESDIHVLSLQKVNQIGFISGTGNGIVTVNGEPAQKRIVLFDRNDNFSIIHQTWSNSDGTYLITYLNPDKLYLVMAVDDKQQYEPVAWDFIKPAVPDA